MEFSTFTREQRVWLESRIRKVHSERFSKGRVRMDFSNLTDDQIEWLEESVKDAYREGYRDGWYNWGDEDGDLYKDTERELSESLAKNSTCHILAERFMTSVEEGNEKMDIIN